MIVKKETPEDVAKYTSWLGRQVVKYSGSSFKSGEKINTVSGFRSHPVTENFCFLFVEDETFVECRRCRVVEIKNTEFQSPVLTPEMNLQIAIGAVNFRDAVIKNLRQQIKNLAEEMMFQGFSKEFVDLIQFEHLQD